MNADLTNPFDNVLMAARRALEDVVMPSVDVGNPLANEQLRLVVRFLELVRQRAAHVAARQRAELVLALDLASAVQPVAAAAPAEVRDGLATAIDEARRLCQSNRIDGLAWRQAADRLDALVACTVRCAARFDDAPRRAVQHAVLVASKRTLDLRRAWYSPLGLDPEASSVPDLDAALDAALCAPETQP